MTRNVLRTAVVAATLLVTALLAAPATAEAAGSISGRVTDADGAPLAGVSVWVHSLTMSPSGVSTTTASDGTFSVPGLSPDSYGVCFSAGSATGGSSSTGYLDRCWKDGSSDGSESTRVVVTEGATNTDIVQALPSGAAVVGTVTDPDGHPVRGAAVRASVYRGGIFSTPQTDVTDAAGHFRLDRLPQSDAVTACVWSADASSEWSTAGYLDGCYGGVGAQGGAAWDLEPSSDEDAPRFSTRHGLVTTLERIEVKPAARITGRLVDEQSRPVKDVRVWASPTHDSTGRGTPEATTDAQGRYTLDMGYSGNDEVHGTRLVPGDYDVWFDPSSTSGYIPAMYRGIDVLGSSPVGEPTVVAAAAGTPTLVDDTLRKAASVSAVVADSGGRPLMGAQVELVRGPREVSLTEESDVDGRVSFTGLPAGTYAVCIRSDYVTGGSSKAGYLDTCHGSSEKPQSITLAAGQKRTGLVLTLRSAVGIQGHVRDTSGPFQLAAVTVSRDGKPLRTTYPNYDGRYSFTRLEPGRYTVCFAPYASTGYLKECWADQAPDRQPTVLDLRPGVQVTDIDATLSSEPPVPDTGAPTVALRSPSTVYSAGTAITVAYSGSDAQTTVADYDVRYRTADWDDARFSAYSSPVAWQHRTDTSFTTTGRRGRTYCYSVRSRDAAGNTSAWTKDRCTSVPLDDRSLKASRGWKRLAQSASYAGTVTRTTTSGSSLTLAGARAAHVGVLVTTCATCGRIGVYVGGRRVGSVSTSSRSTRRHVLITLPGLDGRRGTLKLVAETRGRRVFVDGVLVSRR